ncbi:RNA-dependent DNA polymerase, partial [Peribacillus simplex]
MVDLIDNLYLLTVPLIDGKSECDIEDLFENITLLHEINGREFTKKDKYDVSKYYGKEMFSKYILDNYSDINFNEFRSVLDNINNIIDIYTMGVVDTAHKLEAKNIDKSSADKVPLEI